MNCVAPTEFEYPTTELQKIRCLKERTDKLISVFGFLKSLITLRGKSHYCTQSGRKSEEPLDSVMTELLKSIDVNSLIVIKSQLEEISCQCQREDNKNYLERVVIADSNLNSIQESINSLFIHSVIPIVIREKLVKTIVSQIKYQDLQEEASVNCKVITELFHSISETIGVSDEQTENRIEKLNLELLKLDVLDDRAKAIIGAMTMIEGRRLRIEELAEKDRKRRNRTTRLLAAYIIIGTILIVATPILCSRQIDIKTVHFLGIIPASVMVWSFIGSFAAMIHRFNRKPVYYFDNAMKWMVTRHAQGVILSSAFYLVLISGLFLISGGKDGNTSNIKDEVILILSFLIGFSDRFVDSVFNTLVEKYTGGSRSNSRRVEDAEGSTPAPLPTK